MTLPLWIGKRRDMQLPLWVRRLPHNLSTVRPAIRFRFNRLFWAFGAYPYFHANKGDEHYLFHFEETGLKMMFGPWELFIGFVDTPEENAWIK